MKSGVQFVRLTWICASNICVERLISSLIYELYELHPLKIFSADLVHSISKVCVTFNMYIAPAWLKYCAECLNKIQAKLREVQAQVSVIVNVLINKSDQGKHTFIVQRELLIWHIFLEENYRHIRK